MTKELQETKTPITQPQPGDIIFAVRWKGVYFHYGIYLGNRMVINFQNPNKGGFEISSKSADIIFSTLDEFADGCDLFLEPCFKDYSPRSTEETIETALSLFGSMKGKYDLKDNNCEHYAHWCKYNVDRSEQIDSLEKNAGILWNEVKETLGNFGKAINNIPKLIKGEETEKLEWSKMEWSKRIKDLIFRENGGTPFDLTQVEPINNESRLVTISLIQQKLRTNNCYQAEVKSNTEVGVVFDMYSRPNPKGNLVLVGRDFVPTTRRIKNLPDDILLSFDYFNV